MSNFRLLNRWARIYYQKTVCQLVQDRIHREAELLLKTTLMTPKEIAFEVGVCDPVYFNNCFKRVTGLTPLEFKEKNLHFFSHWTFREGLQALRCEKKYRFFGGKYPGREEVSLIG